MTDHSGSKPPFQGYASPNYTPVPDELFDDQLPDLSGAELKVLLYIIRRTFGFKRESDNISLSQMLHGLRTRDGRGLDRGVGLSKKTLLLAIKSLEEQNIILTQRRRSQEKGDEATGYRLNIRASVPREESTPPVGGKVHHGGGEEIPPGPWGNNSPTQETDGETDIDPSKFERPHDHLKERTRQSSERQVRTNPPPTVREQERVTGANGYASLGDLIESRQKRRPPDGFEEREQLAAFLTDFAAELGDEAPLSSTITRTLNIFTAAGVPTERWGDLLYQARGRTQEATAQIKKQTAAAGSGFRRKNKMPYFLATLEQLTGLRPPPTTRSLDGGEVR
jgi:hypothetical protein